ncbi:cell wall-binding repeat-containing protein [Sinobaca sp. H24]|uniref:cell wall-binding repeat-containing protein n=1 Tax=Sinobaca sp. H24 TaxID=2923376 RepID=UPI00207ACDD9|nr:cell wall-binding repeat-containing protein [Sinobaca sp. H24]
MKKGIKWTAACASLAAFLQFLPASAQADTIMEEIKVEKESSESIEKGEEMKLQVRNSSNNGTVEVNGEEIQTIENGYVEKVIYTNNQEAAFITVLSRYQGNGNIMNVDIYKWNEKKLETVYEEEDIMSGSVTVEDDSIVIGRPDLETAESQAVPEKVETNTISFTEDEVNESGFKEMSLESFNHSYAEESREMNTLANYANPSFTEINELLTRKANEHGIPPELLKAIAWQESTWRQYVNGDPLIGFDGKGIGIMQVTPGYTGLPEDGTPEFEQRLKTDIEYNIDKGIEILLQKWNWTGKIIPQVNDGSKEVVDNWYFALIAYNGISKINDPRERSNTYQAKIFEHMNGNMGSLGLKPFPENTLNIKYTNPNSPNLMIFTDKMKYQTTAPYTRSKENYKKDDVVAPRASVNMRNAPGGAVTGKLDAGQLAVISGPITYQENRLVHHGWYQVKNASGETGYVPASYLSLQRLSGPTRYDTAVEISKNGWMQAETVVIATGEDFPDALSGTPLAHKLNAPILLSSANELPARTEAEINRLNAKNIVILGGTQAISKEVENKLRSTGRSVERISGATRYATAGLIADRVGGSGEYILANGNSYPDALSIAPHAAREGIPILLTRENSVPSETASKLRNSKNITVVGGTSMVSGKVFNSLSNPKRISGSTRYGTAAAVINELNSPKEAGLIVSGENFPDALTGSVLAAKQNGALLLTRSGSIPSETSSLTNNSSFQTIKALGGTSAVSTNTVVNFTR